MPMCKMFIIVDKKFRYHTPPKIGWTQLSVFRSAIFPRYFSALHNTDPEFDERNLNRCSRELLYVIMSWSSLDKYDDRKLLLSLSS